MSTLFTTVIMAFVLVIIAVAGLAIGWLLTGKSGILPGACGRVPTKRKDEKCGTDVTCSLCNKHEEDTTHHVQ